MRRHAAIIASTTDWYDELRFDELVRYFEAARKLARRLVVAWETEFVPVLGNLRELLALARDNRSPVEASRQRWLLLRV